MMIDLPKIKQHKDVSTVNSHRTLALNPEYSFKAIRGKKGLYTWQKDFGLYSTYF